MTEAALCVEELGASNHPSDMVCAWASESLEKKDRERDELVKLLVHLHRHEPPLLSHDQLEKGYVFFPGSPRARPVALISMDADSVCVLVVADLRRVVWM